MTNDRTSQNQQGPPRLQCAKCQAQLDCCAFCDREACGYATCERCLRLILRRASPDLARDAR